MDSAPDMIRNPVRDALARGDIPYGVWMSLMHPDLVEFYGLLGFMYIVVDGENQVLDRRTIRKLAQACRGAGMALLARVPELNPSTIQGYLEAGAIGIICPHVSTAGQARALVSATKFKPLGTRGASTGRQGGYGLVQTAEPYRTVANRQTMVFAYVEDAIGLENLDEILRVEGLDVVGIGEDDLAADLGTGDRLSDESYRLLLQQTERRITAAGKIFDAVVIGSEDARDMLARGARIISVWDQAAIAFGFSEILEGIRAGLPKPK